MRWFVDKGFQDCWDLDRDGKTIAFVMLPRETGIMCWKRHGGGYQDLPGMSCEEAKAVVEAMIRLEG